MNSCENCGTKTSKEVSIGGHYVFCCSFGCRDNLQNQDRDRKDRENNFMIVQNSIRDKKQLGN